MQFIGMETLKSRHIGADCWGVALSTSTLPQEVWDKNATVCKFTYGRTTYQKWRNPVNTHTQNILGVDLCSLNLQWYSHIHTRLRKKYDISPSHDVYWPIISLVSEYRWEKILKICMWPGSHCYWISVTSLLALIHKVFELWLAIKGDLALERG